MENLMQNQNNEQFSKYYSAEFQLDHSKIYYQFKIRKSATEPVFAVVKEGSRALENIKEGDVISMRFYSLDKSVPSCSTDARIKYICKDSTIGFKNHFVVGLDVNAKREQIVA